MKSIKVYDAGDSFVDRYTVVFTNKHLGECSMMLGIDGKVPNTKVRTNFSQCKLISFSELPLKAKLHFVDRINMHMRALSFITQ